ncbi:MAG: DUF429 domain-containing protein [Acidobacteria bacterium]|nr:DUF429 domain-containing protein [Acidobacteriota bacterium]
MAVRGKFIFLGIDLGWYEKPSGAAALHFDGESARLVELDRLETHADVLRWVSGFPAEGVAVDAPLVIRNTSGTREAEKHLNQDYRRYHAGCHPAHLGMGFAPRVLRFAGGLEALGYEHAARKRFQIEVYPHAASVTLFGLDRIVKYKRGARATRARELRRFRKLLTGLPIEEMDLPPVPATGSLKVVEDQLDAVLCAFLALHWWRWGLERNRLYGHPAEGYIVCPARL